jgi:hypothetical protein
MEWRLVVPDVGVELDTFIRADLDGRGQKAYNPCECEAERNYG